jgi:hypothetical protein
VLFRTGMGLIPRSHKIKTWMTTCNNNSHNLATHVIPNKWGHMVSPARLLYIKSTGNTLTHINLRIHHSRMTLTWRNVLSQWWLLANISAACRRAEQMCTVALRVSNCLPSSTINPGLIYIAPICSSLNWQRIQLSNTKIKSAMPEFHKTNSSIGGQFHSKLETSYNREDLCLLGYNSVVRWSSTDVSGKHAASSSQAWFIRRPWRWKRYVPPKPRLTFNGLHGVISRKIEFFIITAARTSHPT